MVFEQGDDLFVLLSVLLFQLQLRLSEDDLYSRVRRVWIPDFRASGDEAFDDAVVAIHRCETHGRVMVAQPVPRVYVELKVLLFFKELSYHLFAAQRRSFHQW